MELRQKKASAPGSIIDSDFVAHFSASASRLRGDYLGTIERWTEHFPESQLFVGFYDEICERPEQLLLNIYSFLGVSASPAAIPKAVRTAVNVGAQEPIPWQLHRHLATMYASSLRQLADRYGGYADRWLQRCNAVLDSDQPGTPA
jgi:hypothetical protein